MNEEQARWKQLMSEEPKLELRQAVFPARGVVIALVCPSGELFVWMTPEQTRNVAAALVEYADELEVNLDGKRN